MAHDVFISYSQSDKPVADAVVAKLESNAIRCWIAPRDIAYGAEWSDAIVAAITSSRAMVLVFTEGANASKQVRREVQEAFERGLLVIPLRIENVRPERGLAYYLGSVHWLDAMTPRLEMGLLELVSTLARVLESKPAASPEPDIGPSLRQKPHPESEAEPVVVSPAVVPPATHPPAGTNTSLPFSDAIMALCVSMHWVCVVWLAVEADGKTYGPAPNVVNFVAACSLILLIAGIVRRRFLEVAIPIVPLFASVPFWLGAGTDATLFAFAALIGAILLVVYVVVLLTRRRALRKKAVASVSLPTISSGR